MEKRRLRHLFAADRRTVIVALDHAAYFGPLPGLEDPGAILDSAVGAGVDAVLTTYGVAGRFSSRLGSLGLILRADGGATQRATEKSAPRLLFGADDALRLGADAVAVMGLVGYPEEAPSLANVAGLVRESAPWGLPVLAEMLVQGAGGRPPTGEDVAFAARVAAELGADLVKAPYAGPARAFRQAIGACHCPVVVLGGERAADAGAVLASVAEALDAGASGVAMGRNVWQHADPGGMMRALVALVHGGATVEGAARELD